MGAIYRYIGLALFFVCVQGENTELTLIKILKQANSDGADSGKIDIPRILKDLSLTLNDTSEAYDDLDLGEIDPSQLEKSCSHGKCEFCTKAKYLKACVIAEILAKEIGFRVALTVNGHTVIQKKISVANPPPFCLNVIPGLKMLADLCFEIYDVNLKDKSACARISFKVKLIHKKINIKLGCFKLPIKEDAQLTDEKETPTTDNEQALMLTDVGLSPNALKLTEADIDDLVKGCSKGKCEFCINKGFKACLEVNVLSSKIGFEIVLTFNGKQVLRQEITVPNPKPFCLNKTPLPEVTDLCLTLEKINLKELSACAKISAKVKIGPLKPKKLEYEQCFKIPMADENTLQLDTAFPDTAISAVGIGLSSDIEDDVLNELLQSCKKGTCKFCFKKGVKACIQADVLSSKIGFDIILTFEGKQVMKQEITVENPKPFCMKKTPVSQVTDLCLSLEKINLKELSACAKLTFKVKIGPMPAKEFKFEKCFKIPKTAEEDRMIAGVMYTATDAEVYQQENENEASEEKIQKEVMDVLKFISNKQI